MMRRLVPLALVLASGVVVAGCSPTPTQRGAMIGGASGAAIGGAATRSWGGAAVGGAVGAAAGAIIADSRGRCYRVNSNGTRTRVDCPR